MEMRKGFPQYIHYEELAEQLDLSALELIRGETFPEEQAPLNEVNKLTGELISIIKEKIAAAVNKTVGSVLILIVLLIALLMQAAAFLKPPQSWSAV